jgi:dUTP pyrophosphatase
MPKRQTEEAVGYDVYLRAVVSAHQMDGKNPKLRKTLFDFEVMPGDPETRKHIDRQNGELVYVMEPQESVLVGIGFVTAMPSGMFMWVAPRSGLASKHGITVTNAPGTVDPDYRGEAGVLVFNRNDITFALQRHMRIAQVIFQWALFPDFQEVTDYEDLPKTARGVGGFGSTGLR